ARRHSACRRGRSELQRLDGNDRPGEPVAANGEPGDRARCVVSGAGISRARTARARRPVGAFSRGGRHGTLSGNEQEVALVPHGRDRAALRRSNRASTWQGERNRYSRDGGGRGGGGGRAGGGREETGGAGVWDW